MTTAGIILLLIIIICFVLPEIPLMAISFLIIFLEFILRLFGKSFDNSPKDKNT